MSTPDGVRTAGPAPHPDRPAPAAPPGAGSDRTPAAAPFDPSKLCIFTTVALLGWLLGPFAALWFAGLAFVGYARAHRAGLTRSRCYLRDVRLVLTYLALVAGAAAYFAGRAVVGAFG